ncbi:MAG: UDP-N-acetylglucosamine 1-carboxyvinyltransferase [Bacillota bacterium]|nr:UDP-N-acetylglucosamine 1-carboxyvinyltransferase [Bacillota bacterium]
MDKYVINGGKSLVGEVNISGAKNAAVAIIPATILADGPCRIENIPLISDVSLIAKIMQDMGANVKRINKMTLEIDATKIKEPVAISEQIREMRASYYLLGALVGKFGCAKVAMPGGCDFGVRPIEQHLKGFQVLGVKHELVNGAVIDVSAEALTGGNVYLDVVSVGATINIMLAAVKAQGLTVIENAAKEPHIVDLANFLNSMGANIKGAGTDVIKIRGVEHLSGTTYTIIPDQIEAGTYMAAAVATRGDVTVRNVIPKHLESITAKIREIGATVVEYDEAVRVKVDGELHRCNIKTMPHPGFPTDMQPQFATLLSTIAGTSIINESVWDNRFQYISELCRMGAHISADGRLAIIEGVSDLTAANIRAHDLRAGAAMIIAGLCAKGITEIDNVEYIERGYEDIIGKLTSLGAEICKERVIAEVETADIA